MTNLTPRQFIDTIVRSLNATWDRMAAKHRGVATGKPAAKTRVRKPERIGNGRGGRSRWKS